MTATAVQKIISLDTGPLTLVLHHLTRLAPQLFTIGQDVLAQANLERGERFAISLSNSCNVLLLAAKIFACVESRSLSIIASTLDSLLDLLSGFILWYTAHSMRRENPYKYPIGKKRMQPLVKKLSSLDSNQDRVMAHKILGNSPSLSSHRRKRM